MQGDGLISSFIQAISSSAGCLTLASELKFRKIPEICEVWYLNIKDSEYVHSALFIPEVAYSMYV
jgi:hypothetical protein